MIQSPLTVDGSGTSGGAGTVGVALPVQEHLSPVQLVELVQQAEALGYGIAYTGEIAGPEVFSLLGALAMRTERIQLATGVVSVFARSPALTAMAFATLAGLAPGRVVAGLGVGSRVVVEDWHGLVFSDASTRLRESVDVIRRLLAGDKVSYEGAALRLSGFRVTVPDVEQVPLVLGAINPVGLRLAGQVADGVLLAFCPPDEVEERVSYVREGARSAGRDPDDVVVYSYVNAYAGADQDAARERMRRLVLQYAVQPTHRRAFARSFPDLRSATELWDAGDRTSALKQVSEHTVDRVCPVGTGSDIAGRIGELRARGIDVPVLFPQSLSFGDVTSPRGTIEAVAEALGA